MLKSSIRIRAIQKGDITEVKCIIKHPMETGYRRTPNTREKISAHFIQKIKCVHNEKTVMDALWGPGISRNPYFAFKFKGGNKGDIIRISWVDNKGSSDTHETFII